MRAVSWREGSCARAHAGSCLLVSTCMWWWWWWWVAAKRRLAACLRAARPTSPHEGATRRAGSMQRPAGAGGGLHRHVVLACMCSFTRRLTSDDSTSSPLLRSFASSMAFRTAWAGGKAGGHRGRGPAAVGARPSLERIDDLPAPGEAAGLPSLRSRSSAYFSNSSSDMSPAGRSLYRLSSAPPALP